MDKVGFYSIMENFWKKIYKEKKNEPVVAICPKTLQILALSGGTKSSR